jgi:hypothetical protein
MTQAEWLALAHPDAGARMHALHAAQGYLAMGSRVPQKRGDLLPPSNFGLWMAGHAWFVLGEATSAEYHEQSIHCAGQDYPAEEDWPYFYRVCAAD